MPPDQRQIVQDIIDFARRVDSIVAGLDFEQFAESEVISITVVHYLQDIGEAARHLAPETRRETPAVPWRSLIGMRNIIVHRYWDRDHGRVWAAATVHVPTLIEVMEDWLGDAGPVEGMED